MLNKTFGNQPIRFARLVFLIDSLNCSAWSYRIAPCLTERRQRQCNNNTKEKGIKKKKKTKDKADKEKEEEEGGGGKGTS